MSGRGHRAALPAAGHARPEYLAGNEQSGLTVRHCNREGRVREYDFAVLPVAAPMQASLAALFAARCAPDRWSAHRSSEATHIARMGSAGTSEILRFRDGLVARASWLAANSPQLPKLPRGERYAPTVLVMKEISPPTLYLCQNNSRQSLPRSPRVPLAARPQ